MTDIEQRAVSTVRGLSMDAPHRAKSGHQGTAMALAPLAHVLYTRIMRYDATDPTWADRDRFVLSAGHASILLYSMLHLTGHGLELDDLKDFRQWDSATPGHPEVGHTAGVEVTTGPLGQGVGNAVGMAIAEQSLRSRFGTEVCDHNIYTVCGDGDLSEGVSHEAASFAGHLGLGRLVMVYDDNHITIDGPTELALSDDPAARFRAYGLHVIEAGEIGDNLDALEAVLLEARAETERPSLIVLRTHIATPSPDVVDTPAAHGYALFDEEIAATKQVMGLADDETFNVPDDVLAFYRSAGSRHRDERRSWESNLDEVLEDRSVYDACIAGAGLADWHLKLPSYEAGESVATRKASAACIDAVADVVPGLIGGGADLTGNTGTTIPGRGTLRPDEPSGRQIFFGIREHAMGATMVGAALHGGTLPIGGTFLVFSDYMRPPIRLASLSGAHAVFVFSHDSVGVGEDGPTHQPIEHIASLRAIPGLVVLRPADANEVAACWRVAIDREGPHVMVLTRQNVPVLDGATDYSNVSKGGYVLADPGPHQVTLVGTGSEVALCVSAGEALALEGIGARVVSMPSTELFAAQSQEYRDSIIPPGIASLAVEAGATMGWHRWVDDAVGIDRFGASAPGEEVLARLGMTPENVASRAKALLANSK
jgi:transketolase